MTIDERHDGTILATYDSTRLTWLMLIAGGVCLATADDVLIGTAPGTRIVTWRRRWTLRQHSGMIPFNSIASRHAHFLVMTGARRTYTMCSMKMNPYLSFKGDCEAAFKYYEQHLGGEIGDIFRYGGTPLSGSVPADWPDKIMHGSITIGGQTLQAADVAAGHYETPRGFSLTLQIKSAADAERMFEALASGGQVGMPLEKTFWAERFGMVTDRFGVPWIINCEG